MSDKGWTEKNRGNISGGTSYENGNYLGVIPPTAIKNGKADGYLGPIVDLEPNQNYTCYGIW